MNIIDAKGMYKIKVDTLNNVVHETPIGVWKVKDYRRYHNEYVSKISTLFKGKPWAKISDLRGYKTSDISSEMSKHVNWLTENNCEVIAFVVESLATKVQVNRVVNTKLTHRAFADISEAEKWVTSWL